MRSHVGISFHFGMPFHNAIAIAHNFTLALLDNQRLAALPPSRMASSSTRGGTGGEQGISWNLLQALRAVSALPKRALQGRERNVALTVHSLCWSAPCSFAILMVYLGISITSSLSPTIAWQLRRDLDSSPHALSSISSSSSDASSRLSKPSRTMTWQVVQAQDFSQACSISIPFSSSASQSRYPVRPRTSCLGAQFPCGKTMIWAFQSFQVGQFMCPLQCTSSRFVHAPLRKFGSRQIQRLDRTLDGLMIVARQHCTQCVHAAAYPRL